MLDQWLIVPSAAINSRMFTCQPLSCGVQKPSVFIHSRCSLHPEVLRMRKQNLKLPHPESGELATTVPIGKVKLCMETNSESNVIGLDKNWSYQLVQSPARASKIYVTGLNQKFLQPDRTGQRHIFQLYTRTGTRPIEPLTGPDWTGLEPYFFSDPNQNWTRTGWSLPGLDWNVLGIASIFLTAYGNDDSFPSHQAFILGKPR